MAGTPQDGDYTAYLKNLEKTGGKALEEALIKENTAFEKELEDSLEHSKKLNETLEELSREEPRAAQGQTPKRRVKILPGNYVPTSAREMREQPTATPYYVDEEQEAKRKAKPRLPPVIGFLIVISAALGFFAVYTLASDNTVPILEIVLTAIFFIFFEAVLIISAARKLRRKQRRLKDRPRP